MINNCIIEGNLVYDGNLTATKNGGSLYTNTIANKSNYKRNGDYVTDFIKFTASNYTADYLAQYARKGQRVIISGRMVNNNYEKKDGTKVSTIEIKVDDCSIVSYNNNDSKPTHEEVEPQKEEDIANVDWLTDDDMPF